MDIDRRKLGEAAYKMITGQDRASQPFAIATRYPLEIPSTQKPQTYTRRQFLKGSGAAAAVGAGIGLAAQKPVARTVSGIANYFFGDYPAPNNDASNVLDLLQRHKDIFNRGGIFGAWPQYSIETGEDPRYKVLVISNFTRPFGMDLRGKPFLELQRREGKAVKYFDGKPYDEFKRNETIIVDPASGEPISMTVGHNTVEFNSMQPNDKETVRRKTADSLAAIIAEIEGQAASHVGRKI